MNLQLLLMGACQKAVSRSATLHEMIWDYGQAASDLQRLISILENQSGTGILLTSKLNSVKSMKICCIMYRAGRKNTVPDALSRKATLQALTGVSTTIPAFMKEIQEACASDSETQEMLQAIQAGKSKKNFSVFNSQLQHKGKQYVPHAGEWRAKLLKEFHSGVIGGHSGVLRTYKRVGRSFSWPGMKKSVKKHVAECIVCQQTHYETDLPPGLLQPNQIPDGAWKDISMDFIEGLPKVGGKSVILVIIDRFSKYAHFLPLSHPYSARSVAQAYIDGVFKLHGFPESIISDRDPVFGSTFWEALFELQGTKLNRSSAYHPQTDGQTENLNRTLEQYLRCMVLEKQVSWLSVLTWAEWWYNTTYHSAIQMTPFEAVYGYPPPAIKPYLPGSTAVHAVDEQLRDRDELLRKLKANLVIAQDRMKRHYDRGHSEREFSVGDWVFLKLQAYRQHSVSKRASQKLAPRYYGPFKVLERIGKVAYKLQLPPSAKIHPVFHVALLKKKIGDHAVTNAHLPPVIDMDNPRWYPAAILKRGLFKKGNVPVVRWLIQWLGSTVEDATWEDADVIKGRFPDFET